jgi:hypothetical protein
VIAIAGLVFRQEAAQGQIIGQIQALVGEDNAKAIQNMIDEARKSAAGIIATVLAVVMMLLGPTGVFAQLQEPLNTIWRVEERPEQGNLENSQSLLHLTRGGSRHRIPFVDLLGHQRWVIRGRHYPGTFSSGPRIFAANNQLLRFICHRNALICNDLQTAP